VATFGQASVNGAKLAFKQINAAGGVLGKQIAFVQADNKSEPSESTNAITKLITQDKVVAVLGAVTSSDTLAAVPVAMQYKIPLVTSMSTNPKVTFENGKVNDYAFRACFIDPFQGTVMANFATNTLKAKNVAIYIDNSSDYAKGLAEFFEKAFVASGGTIVSKEAYLQKDQDFKATLTKIRSSNPDAIFIPGYYQEVGLIAKQARELGIMVPLMGGDGWDSPKLTEIAGKQALNNSFFSNHYTPEDKDPKVVKFVEDYKAEYGQVPDALAALGYDSAMMIVDAIKRANSADPEKIKEALVQTKGLQGVSGMITLNDHHDAVKSAVVIEMIDGAQVFKEKVNP
jgi:branched-chain amino acid transport system substrate-binding protein